MKTLYDFLGALPDDDADSLRAAFRSAAKGAHPDLNPADADAALRFRQIVRANEILSDMDQRAAYDHLLHLARLEQEAAPKRSASVFYRTAIGVTCSVIALAGLWVVSVASYELFLLINRPPLASAQMTQAFRPEPVQAAAVTTELSDRLGRTERHNKPEAAGNRKKPDENPDKPKQAQAPSVVAQDRASANVPTIRDFAANDANHYRERGILAYHSGDLYLALVDFNLAIQFDPNFSDVYIDRAIVFYRIGDQERAFADVAQAKRIHHESIRNTTFPTASVP